MSRKSSKTLATIGYAYVEPAVVQVGRMSDMKTISAALFGAPLDPFSHETRQHIALVAFLAWIGLGADGLSSSCYGPEEAFLQRRVRFSSGQRGCARKVPRFRGALSMGGDVRQDGLTVSRLFRAYFL